MNIIFFVHPVFFRSKSMPRFARMLEDGMKKRGHNTEIWTPKALFCTVPAPNLLKKWLGYVDQYILFPLEVRKRMKSLPAKTIFVFTDQAQGPWIPLIVEKAHVIHCHDLMAQRSALGEIPENPTSWTGRMYQSYIRKGFSKGKNFISVSQNTRDELHYFLSGLPDISETVYNGLNPLFSPSDPQTTRAILGKKLGIDLSLGYLLHVGGNQWYKNRAGAIEIYNAWRAMGNLNIPLLMIGNTPDDSLRDIHSQSHFKGDIHFLCEVEDDFLRLAYAGALVFLFPSLAEGFGWPIAEAMASGCPVITTGEAPMTEVAGGAAFLIPRKPCHPAEKEQWAIQSARTLDKIICFSPNEREKTIQVGLDNVKRFNADIALDQMETIYRKIFNSSTIS